MGQFNCCRKFGNHWIYNRICPFWISVMDIQSCENIRFGLDSGSKLILRLSQGWYYALLECRRNVVRSKFVCNLERDNQPGFDVNLNNINHIFTLSETEIVCSAVLLIFCLVIKFCSMSLEKSLFIKLPQIGKMLESSSHQKKLTA